MYTVSRGELIMDFAFKLRSLVFNEWLDGALSVKAISSKYGISRKCFYKYKKRFLKMSFEGLKDKKRASPSMPHALSIDKRCAILECAAEQPTKGVRRIRERLLGKGVIVSEGAIWNFLHKESLNTRYRRRLWAHSQGKNVLTEKERALLESRGMNRHIESHAPGELISIDTFTVSVRGLGKIWQYTACDTYSSYGWAKLYRDKTADNSVDFVFNHMVRNCPQDKIRRILTDQGTEFYCARHEGVDGYFTTALRMGNINHTVTKKAHPWTNGYAERLNQTIWQEFYLYRLTREFTSIEELQQELDQFMAEYNFKRMHSGYKLKAGGFKFPGHAFFDIRERKKMIEIKY